MPDFSTNNTYILATAVTFVIISIILSLFVSGSPENINKMMDQAKNGDMSGDAAVAFTSGIFLITGALIGFAGLCMMACKCKSK